jgi:drug/metabolite transporter (DMT)-like permease
LVRLIALGTLAALFFSSTFILNRAMSLAGGDWVWSASLRFGYMFVFLIVIILMAQGRKVLADIKDVFLQHWRFWILAGTIGFGIFYALVTFSASFAAAWVLATTWQITILATPVVLHFFNRKVPTRGLLFTGIIFIGIVLVNIEHAQLTSLREMIYSAVPVLIAAFAYPVGNQLVWEARLGENKRLPHITHPILENGLARVLLLTVGSLPFWILFVALTAPPAPSQGQLVSTALVALFSGVIATTIFLYARHLCKQSYEIAAVDATQSMEVIFSLIGEIVFLRGMLPSMLGLIGVALTMIGLGAYMLSQQN